MHIGNFCKEYTPPELMQTQNFIHHKATGVQMQLFHRGNTKSKNHTNSNNNTNYKREVSKLKKI